MYAHTIDLGVVRLSGGTLLDIEYSLRGRFLIVVCGSSAKHEDIHIVFPLLLQHLHLLRDHQQFWERLRARHLCVHVRVYVRL
jgi:hypothetical protein